MAYSRPTQRHYGLQDHLNRACELLNEAADSLDQVTGDVHTGIWDPTKAPEERGFADVCPDRDLAAIRRVATTLRSRERDLYKRATRMGLGW